MYFFFIFIPGSETNDFKIEKLSSGRRQGTSKKSCEKQLLKICNKSLDSEYKNILNLIKQNRTSDRTGLNIESAENKEKIDNNVNGDVSLLDYIWNERKIKYEDCWKRFRKDISIFKGWPTIELEKD